MRRLALALTAVFFLNSCSLPPMQELPGRLLAAAGAQAQGLMAQRLQGLLGERIPQVISLLAQPGGYLNNPLVRILLPPPLSLALGIAQELAAAPETPPLQVLLNRAAELAIPGAGPILTETLRQFRPDEMLRLLTAGETAVTQSLRQRSHQLVVNVVEAKVAAELADSGALGRYLELKQAYAAQQALAEPALEVAMQAPEVALQEYVTTAAVDGLFRLLGDQERNIRDQIGDLESHLPARILQ